VIEQDWPEPFRPVLRKLVENGHEYFGLDSVAVKPLHQLERPFSSLLQIRVVGDARTDATRDAFVKILKPRANSPAQIASMRENVVRDFEMTTRVRDGLSGYPGLTAVRPIACFPEDLAIVTERAPGVTLADLLARGAVGWPGSAIVRDLSSILGQVGAWLKAVQSTFPQERTIDPETFRTYLDKRLTQLQHEGSIRLTDRGRAAIETYQTGLLRAIGGPPTAVWVHADFCPENVLARDGRITVLDFTMAKSGTVYTDLAHLHVRIDCMKAKPWFRSAVVDRLQEALLESFEHGLSTSHPLFALMALQHVICHLLVLQTAGRPALARLYGARLHARHREWLRRHAGVGEAGWRR
jgi:hypothetical protein